MIWGEGGDRVIISYESIILLIVINGIVKIISGINHEKLLLLVLLSLLLLVVLVLLLLYVVNEYLISHCGYMRVKRYIIYGYIIMGIMAIMAFVAI